MILDNYSYMRGGMMTGRPTANFFIWIERFFGPLYFISYEIFSTTTVSRVKRLLHNFDICAGNDDRSSYSKFFYIDIKLF